MRDHLGMGQLAIVDIAYLHGRNYGVHRGKYYKGPPPPPTHNQAARTDEKHKMKFPGAQAWKTSSYVFSHE